jgi:hypothetical protein
LGRLGGTSRAADRVPPEFALDPLEIIRHWRAIHPAGLVCVRARRMPRRRTIEPPVALRPLSVSRSLSPSASSSEHPLAHQSCCKLVSLSTVHTEARNHLVERCPAPTRRSAGGDISHSDAEGADVDHRRSLAPNWHVMLTPQATRFYADGASWESSRFVTVRMAAARSARWPSGFWLAAD